jgi:hypothetical protein
MKKEKQVISLELAEKLDRLGFEQDSLFYISGDNTYSNNWFSNGNSPKI